MENSACTWPSGTCKCYEAEQAKTSDIRGRVWMQCENGLSLTKASMTRFMMFCLTNEVEIGEVYAFNPKFKGSSVIAMLRIHPDLIEEFEKETGGKLRTPPKINVGWVDKHPVFE